MATEVKGQAAKPLTFEEPVFQVPTRTLDEQQKVAYDVLRYVPEESAEHYKIAPLAVVDGVLEIGMVDPDNLEGIDALNFIARATGMPFKVFRITQIDFDKVLKMYRGLTGEVDRAVSELQVEQDVQAQKQTKPTANDGEEPLLDLDDPALSQSQEHRRRQYSRRRADDQDRLDHPALCDRRQGIRHPHRAAPHGVRVRYRVDGDLHTSVILPPQYASRARRAHESPRLDPPRRAAQAAGRPLLGLDRRPRDRLPCLDLPDL